MASRVSSSTLGTPPDTYLYALALAPHAQTFATIGSDNTLRLFDAELRLQHTQSQLHTNGGVDVLVAGGPAHYITGGRDGAIRCWDARSAAPVAEFHDPAPSSSGIASLAVNSAGGATSLLAAGTASAKEGLGDVSVLLFDARRPGAPAVRNYTDSHTDSITALAFHPQAPEYVLSGSTDGLVSIFDARVAEEEDALLQVLNPRAAVHAAGWMPGAASGGQREEVFVLTTDEQFGVHTLPGDWTAPTGDGGEDGEVVPPPRDFGDVRQALECMYVVGVMLQEQGLPLMAYGNNERQTLGIVGLQRGSAGPTAATAAWEFGPQVDLPGAHGEEVVRDVLVVDGGRRAYSCGEDGRVVAWGLGG